MHAERAPFEASRVGKPPSAFHLALQMDPVNRYFSFATRPGICSLGWALLGNVTPEYQSISAAAAVKSALPGSKAFLAGYFRTSSGWPWLKGLACTLLQEAPEPSGASHSATGRTASDPWKRRPAFNRQIQDLSGVLCPNKEALNG